MKKHIIASIVFISILALDIISKNLIESHLHLYERVDVIGSFVQFILLYNDGGVFGLAPNHQNVFLVISSVVLLLMLGYYIIQKPKTTSFCVLMAMIFAGAVGNILDRALQKPGVVDFIYIGNDKVFRWFAFNVADSAIVVGGILLLLYFVMEEKKERNERKKNITE